MEIIAGNRSGLLLTGLNRQRMADRIERSVLVIASRVVSSPSADQIRHWGVAAQRAIARVKAAGIGSLEAPDAYFAALLDRIARGDPRLVRELTLLWDATPAHLPETIVWDYTDDWTVPNGDTMHFHCVAARVNTQDFTEIHDWIPADVESYSVLHRHLATLRRRSA
jgi:hypothetical protein